MSRRVIVMVVLAGVTLAVYAPSLQNDFVDLDDPQYITQNDRVREGLTADNVAWAFTTLHFLNWHPLTWLSHMAACEAFGLRPGAHHAIDVALHAANVLLLFQLLRVTTRATWPSAAVAALFAWHPLHVESVAWVSERKDTLSTLFWLLATLAYVRYVRSHSWRWYGITLLCLALGLMAKSMLVTFPFALLLLDYWPLNRWGGPRAWRRLVVEKLPMLAMSAGASVMSYLAQQAGGVLDVNERLPITIRMANAVWSYVAYLGMALVPRGLAAHYPHPWLVAGGIPAWKVAAAGALLVAITIAAVRVARRRPYVPVGWFWYLGTLVPVIGLVQLGGQAMADRYTYVPLIGIFIVVAWLMADLIAAYPAARVAVAATALTALTIYAVLATVQVTRWRDSYTLFSHSVAVTKNNYAFHFNLAAELFKRGRYPEAAEYYAQVVRVMPQRLDARINLGATLEILGDRAGAERQYREALRIDPNDPDARANLEALLARNGPSTSQPAGATP